MRFSSSAKFERLSNNPALRSKWFCDVLVACTVLIMIINLEINEESMDCFSCTILGLTIIFPLDFI